MLYCKGADSVIFNLLNPERKTVVSSVEGMEEIVQVVLFVSFPFPFRF